LGYPLLIGTGYSSGSVDSARQNLASTFVNAFVNGGFGKDKLMTTEDDSNSNASWIYKNKDHGTLTTSITCLHALLDSHKMVISAGMLSATASLGLIHLWDVENGLTAVDKYLYSNEDNIKAGALLAIGMLNSGVRGDGDYAYALLKDTVDEGNDTCRIASIFG